MYFDHVIPYFSMMPYIGTCELIPQDLEILQLYGGICNSVQPVALNECPERCAEDGVINCCIPLIDTRITDFECGFQPGLPLTLKYSDVTDCECSPCG